MEQTFCFDKKQKSISFSNQPAHTAAWMAHCGMYTVFLALPTHCLSEVLKYTEKEAKGKRMEKEMGEIKGQMYVLLQRQTHWLPGFMIPLSIVMQLCTPDL